MRRNSMRIAQEMKFWPQPVPELALHMYVLCSRWPLGKPEGLLCYLQQLVGAFYPHLRTVPTSLQFQASPYFRLLLPLALVLTFVLGFPAFCSQGLGFGLTSTTNTCIHTHTHFSLETCAFIFLPHGHALALTLCLGAQNWGQERKP